MGCQNEQHIFPPPTRRGLSATILDAQAAKSFGGKGGGRAQAPTVHPTRSQPLRAAAHPPLAGRDVISAAPQTAPSVIPENMSAPVPQSGSAMLRIFVGDP